MHVRLGSTSAKGLRASLALAAGLLAVGPAWTRPVSAQPFPTNNDPAHQIRFETPAQAEARRTQLIRFIWDSGLPTTTPAVTTHVSMPPSAIGIDPAQVARIDRLDVNVSGWDFRAVAYLMNPVNPINAARAVIVHQGHANDLAYGVGDTANHLLLNGFTVVVMMMPLYGWNHDTTAVVPGYGTLTYGKHGDMILKTGPANGGWGFRLFLEPVVQVINHLVATIPDLKDVGMVGLSGGGWTTSLMSAIDARIRLSAPVAGSSPLYQRNAKPADVGDPEQYYTPLYDENVQPDGSGGGVCTWLEIYALGGIGSGRRQIQVSNEFDTCCFAGTFADGYKAIVARKAAALGGAWSHLLDTTHKSHQISAFAITHAINPLFGITRPVAVPSGLPIRDEFNDQSGAFPGGWTLDPSSGGGASAVENAGKVAISGPGLASIARDAPFNAQVRLPITLSLRIQGLTADNFPGVFITDQIGTRPHQVGPLINGQTGEVAINADNGDGFNAAGDRLTLGAVPDYDRGPATLSLTFDRAGFSVAFEAQAGGRFSSGRRPWSAIPNGFDPANLGTHAQVFIQSFDLDGGSPASLGVDSLSIAGTFVTGDADGDADVDADDLGLLVDCFSGPTIPLAGRSCSIADWDADNDVDQADFAALQRCYGGKDVAPPAECVR
jgi:hypothetical protein